MSVQNTYGAEDHSSTLTSMGDTRMNGGDPGGLPSRARVVALGGGTGLPILLRGLKQTMFEAGRPWDPMADANRITAVVTMADDGGSSGRLRRTLRMLPPGDARNCLLALSDGDDTITSIFNYRFDGGGELRNHSLGNLILAALTQIERDFARASERAGEILSVRGRVFPSTCEQVGLIADLSDGTHVEGESRIALTHRPIERVRLDPADARALPEVLAAIAAADLIVIGPGSLYTSLLPILLVRPIAEAIGRSRAHVALVMNLMTEPGETDGYKASDFIRAIWRHCPALAIHTTMVNMGRIPPHLLAREEARGSLPIRFDPEALHALGCHVEGRDLLGDGPDIRHDPLKLGTAVLPLAAKVPA